MWGNVLGWKISVGMFLIAVAVVWWLHSQMQITDPTSLSLDPKKLAELSPPAASIPIVDQTVSGDAGQKYRAAIAMFDDQADACEEFSHKPEGTPPQALGLLLEAAHLSSMKLFAANPGEIIDYQSDHPALDNLVSLGRELESAALMLGRAGKADQEREYLEAAYALGQNLFRERVDYDEYSCGMGLMNGATTVLAEMEPADSPRQKRLQDQQAAMSKFDQENVRPIYDVLSSVDPQKIAANAGDVFRFAARAGERMFRVEAILKLGRYRFNSATSADQLAAPRFLRRFSGDGDPVIRAAADAAGSLTVEQYRMIH